MDCYISKNKNRLWHAKFAIGLRKENNKYIPVILVLGSSNLTNKAYKVGIDDFNYEIDTILWDDIMYHYTIDKKLIEESENKGLAPIVASTDPNKTYNNENEYLNWFYGKFKADKDNELEKL